MDTKYKVGEHPDIPRKLRHSKLKKHRGILGKCDKEDDGCVAIF